MTPEERDQLLSSIAERRAAIAAVSENLREVAEILSAWGSGAQAPPRGLVADIASALAADAVTIAAAVQMLGDLQRAIVASVISASDA